MINVTLVTGLHGAQKYHANAMRCVTHAAHADIDIASAAIRALPIKPSILALKP